MLEAEALVAPVARAARFTGPSGSGEFAVRWIINGGGAGRKYLPSANAPIAMTAAITSGFVAFLPSRDAQSSQRAPAMNARQLLRVSLAPQFAQKFERLIVGVRRGRRIIFGVRRQSEARTALWITRLFLPYQPHCKYRSWFCSRLQTHRTHQILQSLANSNSLRLN